LDFASAVVVVVAVCWACAVWAFRLFRCMRDIGLSDTGFHCSFQEAGGSYCRLICVVLRQSCRKNSLTCSPADDYSLRTRLRWRSVCTEVVTKRTRKARFSCKWGLAASAHSKRSTNRANAARTGNVCLSSVWASNRAQRCAVMAVLSRYHHSETERVELAVQSSTSFAFMINRGR
jgi:hypothetical protein